MKTYMSHAAALAAGQALIGSTLARDEYALLDGSRVSCILGARLPSDLKRGESISLVHVVETAVAVSHAQKVSGAEEFSPVMRWESAYTIVETYRVGNHQQLRKAQ